MKSLDKIKKTKLKKPKVKKEWKKDENYIAYEPEDKHTEAGYELDKGFHAQVQLFNKSIYIWIEFNVLSPLFFLHLLISLYLSTMYTTYIYNNVLKIRAFFQ